MAAEVSEQLVEVPGIIFSTLQAARVLQLSPAEQKKHRLNLQSRCCARFSFDLLFTGFSRIFVSGYLLFGCCYYFQGKGGVCGHLLGLSINNMVAMSPTIITPYVYKDSLVVIETILMALIQLFFGLTCTFKQ